ncbi:MAG: stress response translation initiation inhibitor YciH [Promethearchaeota archaeon]
MKLINNNTEICPKCSNPKELCVCDGLFLDELQITIYLDKRKWGKTVTLIKFEGAFSENLQDFLKKAKRKVASGGTIRGNEVELMGDHRFKLKQLLIEEGFSEDNIMIKD